MQIDICLRIDFCLKGEKFRDQLWSLYYGLEVFELQLIDSEYLSEDGVVLAKIMI